MEELKLIEVVEEIARVIYPERECTVRFGDTDYNTPDKYFAMLSGIGGIPFICTHSKSKESAFVKLAMKIGFHVLYRNIKDGTSSAEDILDGYRS